MAKPGTLKIDHHVLSAEGTRYIVRYVALRTYDGVEEEQADLAELRDGGSWGEERITLPVSELRRVTAEQRVPITGMPEVRPRCVMCRKPLSPDVETKRDLKYRVLSRTFRGWLGYATGGTTDERFCTHRCEAAFARAAFRAGYRIIQKGKDTPT